MVVCECLVKEKQDTSTTMDPAIVIKLQALWRGYRSRKGQILPCCECGYPMTLKAPVYPETMAGFFMSEVPCSWCQVAAYDKHDREDLGPCPCRDCCVSDEEELYIPCCMCGDNCEGGDYERQRWCSRRCMVAWNRD